MADLQTGPSPAGGDRNRGPTLMGILWTETALTLVVLTLRFYSRLLIRKIGWDDWLMLLTVVLFAASTIFAALQDSVGGYRHIYYLTTEAAVKALEYNFILRGVHILSLATGKASVGALILRLIGSQKIWQKWVAWVVIVFTVIVNVLNCIFNFVQCRPVQANWNPNIPRSCWNKSAQLNFAYFMSTENVIADAVLAIIPATFISRLNMSRRRRINLSILLGLGLMAMICGVVKITELNTIINDPDFTWGEYFLTIWGLSEVFVIIMCGSMPALKPLWDRYFAKGRCSLASSASASASASASGRGEESSHPVRKVDQSRQEEGLASCHILHESSREIRDAYCWDPVHGIRATTCIEVTSAELQGKSARLFPEG